MTDPMVSAARSIVERCAAEIGACVVGVPPEGLNWRPRGEETNSMAVLAVHAVASSRTWLSVAVGAAEPARDRDAEFRTTVGSVDELLAVVDEIAEGCRHVLATDGDVDWAAVRAPTRRPGSAPEPITAGWTLLHAMTHLREHVAHLQLTRTLWDARG